MSFESSSSLFPSQSDLNVMSCVSCGPGETVILSTSTIAGKVYTGALHTAYSTIYTVILPLLSRTLCLNLPFLLLRRCRQMPALSRFPHDLPDSQWSDLLRVPLWLQHHWHCFHRTSVLRAHCSGDLEPQYRNCGGRGRILRPRDHSELAHDAALLHVCLDPLRLLRGHPRQCLQHAFYLEILQKALLISCLYFEGGM